jgi:fumarylacetoacetate (FAA) hydrolase
MIARASADVRLRPGDLIGSGTVGTGCLLEVRDEILKRYLQPADTVTLAVERLGELTTPIVERPAQR